MSYGDEEGWKHIGWHEIERGSWNAELGKLSWVLHATPGKSSPRGTLVLCALATIGDTSAQLGPHGRACLQVGNSKTAVVAALVHCFPYIGFPRAVAAIRAVKNL